MAGRTLADISFPIEGLPQSCLEMLAILRRLEAFVTAKIEWKSTWPPVDDKTLGLTFPLINYDGPTQSPEKALLSKHHARRDEFQILGRMLPEQFAAIELPAPQLSEFQIPEIVPPRKRSVKPADRDRILRESQKTADFWVRLAGSVQAEAFKRKELIPYWMPEVVNWPKIGEPPANRKIFPSCPIRSLSDMEKWLGWWHERCRLPDPPVTSSEPGTTGRQEKCVTIKVPCRRPPFQSPIEKVWRCRLEDLTRELRNCRRSFLTWGLAIDVDQEGDPPDFSTAEDRITRVINHLREYQQSALVRLGAGYSDREIAEMPVPELLAKLATAPTKPFVMPSVTLSSGEVARSRQGETGDTPAMLKATDHLEGRIKRLESKIRKPLRSDQAFMQQRLKFACSRRTKTPPEPWSMIYDAYHAKYPKDTSASADTLRQTHTRHCLKCRKEGGC